MFKQTNHQHIILRKQTPLIKVDEEDSVFDEADGHIDTLDNSVATLLTRTNAAKSTKNLINGDFIGSIIPKPTCSSHIQRGKCIGKDDNLLFNNYHY